MSDLLLRVSLVKSCLHGKRPAGNDFMDAEIVFLQFRKMLEQIAFASLVANKDVYSKVQASFATDWNAKRMVKKLTNVNPHFYPKPLKHVGVTIEDDGTRHHRLEPLLDGFLTEDDFVQLYDHCGNMLHEQNPYSGITTIHVGRTPQDWLGRIETLVKLHRAQLVTGSCWIVAVPDTDGKVHTYSAEPSTPRTTEATNSK